MFFASLKFLAICCVSDCYGWNSLLVKWSVGRVIVLIHVNALKNYNDLLCICRTVLIFYC